MDGGELFLFIPSSPAHEHTIALAGGRVSTIFCAYRAGVKGKRYFARDLVSGIVLGKGMQNGVPQQKTIEIQSRMIR